MIAKKPSYEISGRMPGRKEGRFTPRRPNYTPRRPNYTPERTETPETQAERNASAVKRKQKRVQSLETEFMQLVKIRADGEEKKKREEAKLEEWKEKECKEESG